MATNKTAYTHNIFPNGSGKSSSGASNSPLGALGSLSAAVATNTSTTSNPEDLVHQTSAAWVLTFLRWSIRDTLRTSPTITANFATIANQPLVVENDCIQLSVSDSKSVLTPSMTATLLLTDVNYETDVSPGDFVFVNMLNWESEARRVADNARNMQAINGVDDGFKGFFKVQSVRKSLMTDPQSGTKFYAVKITGFAFTEFNNSIYFNPYLIDKSDQNLLLFTSQLNIDWSSIQSDKGLNDIQQIVKALIQCFIGTGFTDQGRKVQDGTILSANTHFYMPQGVGNLLGLDGLESAKDAYNFLFGIQSYSANQNQTLAQGMTPTGISPDATDSDRFMLIPGSPVEGVSVTRPEYWNQVKAWSILNQFTNAPLNELYTCFRISPNGSVMPTMVFRQIPFTTDNFDSGSYSVTKFMNVPRWNIDPALAFSFDLGKDEVARINFVQYFGRSVNGPAGYDISDEIAKQNYLYDIDDVKRNGLKPYVVTSEFDRTPTGDSQGTFRSPGWAKIVGDALIGGHLKLSGTISFVGIPEPIAVGDNLQFDNVVYHIEQVMHVAMIGQDGKKTFRTTITVSNGVDIQSGQNVVYSEMQYGSAYDKRQADYDSTQILPGVSESQDIKLRPISPDQPLSPNQSFKEPNTNTSINSSKRTP